MAAGAGGRVLVVEDEPSIRFLLTASLEDEGYEVRCAAHGEEGLALLREWRPDVIVLDLMMPVMDGETFREHQDESTLGIPLIVLSGRSIAREIGERLGAARTIIKPFDLDVVVSAVAEVANAR